MAPEVSVAQRLEEDQVLEAKGPGSYPLQCTEPQRIQLILQRDSGHPNQEGCYHTMVLLGT